MPKIAGYPPLPPHLAEHGVTPKEYRAFLDLIARHQALAAKKFPPSSGSNRRLSPRPRSRGASSS